MGVVQELASLTMSMMKSRANPTAQDALYFYERTDLYPYTDVFGSNEKETIAEGSYLIISEKD